MEKAYGSSVWVSGRSRSSSASATVRGRGGMTCGGVFAHLIR